MNIEDHFNLLLEKYELHKHYQKYILLSVTILQDNNQKNENSSKEFFNDDEIIDEKFFDE